MKDYKLQNHYKATSQIVYSPPLLGYNSYSQNNFMPKSTKPKQTYEMTDRELLKEQFYLSRFIKTLKSNTTMPTLPNDALLMAIKRQNDLMQQKVEALRTGTYEQYLMKKLNNLGKQVEAIKSISRAQSMKNTIERPTYEKQISY